MYPINNIAGIEKQEKLLEGNHVIVLLLVKPSDSGAEEYIKKINYLHYRSKKYCSIYWLGYSPNFGCNYSDVTEIPGTDNQKWQYSDKCFTKACDELRERLSNWRYSGEPEIIVLQNNSASDSRKYLNFSNYNYIDINYGIKKEYIDSFPRFMERLIDACKTEVSAIDAVALANRKRISPRKVLELAIEECPRLPKPIKKIFNDRMFYKSYKSKAA